MKIRLLTLLLLLSVMSLNAQVKQQVIASAGGFNTGNGVSLSWTLGETIVPTFTAQDGSITLTHGFQQRVVVTAIQENIEVSVDIKVYPNPAIDVVNIRFESPVDDEVQVSLLDSYGRLVKSDVMEAGMTEKQLNLQDVPGGIYYLRIIKGRLINVYKVVKL